MLNKPKLINFKPYLKYNMFKKCHTVINRLPLAAIQVVLRLINKLYIYIEDIDIIPVHGFFLLSDLFLSIFRQIFLHHFSSLLYTEEENTEND